MLSEPAQQHVYATGRSSRAGGASEIGRPETIEETGELIGAAGGSGTALVVDHEDPAAVERLVAAIDAICTDGRGIGPASPDLRAVG